MLRSLLRNFLFVFSFTGCALASRNVNSNYFRNDDPGNRPGLVTSALPASDTSLPEEKDSLLNAKPQSLMELPQTDDGEIVLSEGFYEADFKSYCLQPGTPSPSDRDAYRQGPLTGYRKDIIETILRNSLQKPELEQRNIQLLLWSVVSGSDFRKLSWEVQSTAGGLLSRKQIFELKGGVMGMVRTVSAALPETGANNKLKELFELGTSSYELFERVAVLQQAAEQTSPSLVRDQWYKQADGYYLRYFPSGYQKVKVQVYVPHGIAGPGNDTANYLLFDPVTMMAIPTHSNSQRLGIGAPVIDVIRRIIHIQQGPGIPKKPPVKNNNPKGVVMK